MNVRLWLLFISAIAATAAVAQEHAVLDWSYTYDGPAHGVDLPADAMLGSDGNVYMTGKSQGDILTLRIPPSGDNALVLRYVSSYGLPAEGICLRVDPFGSIYVAGWSFRTSSRSELVLLKYSPSGTLLWDAHFLPDSADEVLAQDMAFHQNGTILVAGSMYGRGRRPIVLLAYDTSGVLRRTSVFGDDTTFHRAAKIIPSEADTVFIAGSREYLEPGNDFPTVQLALMAVDTQGTLLWKDYRYGWHMQDALFDRNGDLIVVWSENCGIAKYSRDGTLQWLNDRNEYTNPAIVTGVSLNSAGLAIVGGYDGWSRWSYAVTWMLPDGMALSTVTHHRTDSTNDYCMAQVIDGNDNIILTGHSAFLYENSVCWTVKLSPHGEMLWETTFEGSPGGHFQGEHVFLDDSDNVYVAGRSLSGNGSDYMVLRYRQESGTPVASANERTSPVYELGQNFPNPFNPTTTVGYFLPARSKVTLRVFDLLGREVALLFRGEQIRGHHRTTFSADGLPTGVYLVRMEAGKYSAVRRMLLIK